MPFATYEDFETYLKHLEKFGMVFGLHHIEALLSSLGAPQRAFKTVHIAGSNGKGSTAAMIQQALTDSGLRCGLYTSPHLQRFSERFKIDGLEINREDLLAHASRLKSGIEREKIPDGFTYFDFTTAMAFDYFAAQGVDIAVIETGLGGRLDSTNIIRPVISVITPISLEHTQVLGDSLKEIAAEKAGIIKGRTPVIIGKQLPEALDVLLTMAREKDAPASVFGRDYHLTIHGNSFDYHQEGLTLPNLKTSLMGNHQKENAATAIRALLTLKERGVSVDVKGIPQSLQRVVWPGRGELFHHVADPTMRLMLDGAHNPEGAEILARTLETLDYNQLRIMIGILADKDIPGIAEKLLSLADQVIAVTPHNERAPDVEAFSRNIRPFLEEETLFETAASIAEGIPLAVKKMQYGDLFVITGSLYTVGEARDLIEQDRQWQKL